jgi:flagellar P-ring protein precursor FlgI
VGGFGAAGSDGSKITVNIPSVGRIPSGGTVERVAPTSLGGKDVLVYNLHDSDFTSAKRMADAINDAIGMGTAQPLDATSVVVQAPLDRAQRVSYISVLENLTLEPGEAPAKVIINSRTGTVVIGEHVRVTAAAVAHGNLTVTITEKPTASQPAPFSGGNTVIVPATDIKLSQETNRMFLFEPGVSLDKIVRAVNQVGAAPGDLVAILEALREAGALHAELIVL